LTPAQVLELPILERGGLRQFKGLNPLPVSLEGIQRVTNTSLWISSADAYTYEVRALQAGVALGTLLCESKPFAIFRTEVVGEDVIRQCWALTDRWDEHVQAIDSFNLPDPETKPVTALDADIIPALPRKSFVLPGQII
jgi:hypothetical protein